MEQTFPTQVGPYRIEGLVGSGGMGIVYRAWDERLKRRVAIKHVRADRTASPGARERFRREAQAAARLSHPAIVQIFDLLEHDDGEWIVMELVEGRPLSQLVGDGRLGVQDVLELGRQIAEGLAEAHAKGIVHRDLKTENVLVTSAGRARILDFGLAKDLAPENDEKSLSRDGALLGTSRAMSPEQARSQPVDHRSDLFSLGTLLYEALTGTSPFAAESPLETLTRVVSFEPDPVLEHLPEVPPEVSELIERLLRKEPALRPQSAAEVAAVLARALPPSGSRPAVGAVAPALSSDAFASEPTVVAPRREPARSLLRVAILVVVLAAGAGLGAWLWQGRHRPPAPPIYVAVTEPEIASGGDIAGTDLIAAGVRLALVRGLVALEGVAALSPELVDPVTGTPAEVARATAADEVLTARLDCRAQLCRVAFHRVHGSDGSVVWPGEVDLPIDDFRLIATPIMTYLRRAYRGHGVDAAALEREVSRHDYESFLGLRRRYFAASNAGSLDEILAGLEQVRRSSPRFLETYLFEVRVARRVFHDLREASYLERAITVAEEALALAPEDPDALVALTEAALEGRRLERAEAALESLERLVPGDPRVAMNRAWLLELGGAGDEALALRRRAARDVPSWRNLFNLATTESGQGEFDAARQTLERLLEIFPDHLESRSFLAQLEVVSGSLERAAELYRELVERTPGFAELSNLGLVELFLGQYEEAARSYRRAAEMAPENPASWLNLGDAEMLLGREARAEKHYAHVLELAARDPGAGGWQTLTVQAQAAAHLGRIRPAVAALQEVLRIASENPQAAYEASLVYALVGDRASALVNAEKAVAGGIAPLWFDLPWFDDLHQDPDFLALLQPEEAAAER